ncbi:hypothetical protein FHX15_001209 [Rhizobium sp. BK650]|uniref:hypothetical protein n=1 Tax=Rhizobium sp. BK650 TaxID=2586990 RepID=UPI001614A9DC|nr:hypothetical protein [Rhizobium sp. BK650]MBB3655996.1 hypothetical protein [Rhizobium sp. BK650]
MSDLLWTEAYGVYLALFSKSMAARRSLRPTARRQARLVEGVEDVVVADLP